jgi:hypothetical protein
VSNDTSPARDEQPLDTAKGCVFGAVAGIGLWLLVAGIAALVWWLW